MKTILERLRDGLTVLDEEAGNLLSVLDPSERHLIGDIREFIVDIIAEIREQNRKITTLENENRILRTRIR